MPRLDWQAEDKASYDVDIPFHQERKIIEQLVSRPFRDRAFSSVVKSAYRDTCAITGLKIINGGGRSEVQAAHIKPVEDSGPDSVRNGIALSSTVHWMFDRGLISVEDDYSLLVAKKLLPDTVNRLLGDDPRLWIPENPELRPHPKFLAYHRQSFKG
jgi:putative restriction endonuclease